MMCFEEEEQACVHDLLYVARDTKMYIPEKRFYIELIDKLYYLGYYKNKNNDGEKASLFWSKS